MKRSFLKFLKLIIIFFLYVQIISIYNVWINYPMISFFIIYLNFFLIGLFLYIKTLKGKIKSLKNEIT